METMSTKKNGKALADDDGIAVYEIRFNSKAVPDIGLDDAGGMGCVRVKEGRTITYYPRRRHHVIIEAKRERPIYVHETWCTWSPLE